MMNRPNKTEGITTKEKQEGKNHVERRFRKATGCDTQWDARH